MKENCFVFLSIYTSDPHLAFTLNIYTSGPQASITVKSNTLTQLHHRPQATRSTTTWTHVHAGRSPWGCAFTMSLPEGDTNPIFWLQCSFNLRHARTGSPGAHLIHGGVEGEELGVPVGAPRLLVLPLELLGADVPQQVLQAGVRLQAAQVEVRRGEGGPRGLLRECLGLSGPCLLENNTMVSYGLDTRLPPNTSCLSGMESPNATSAVRLNGHHGSADAITETVGCFVWGKQLYLTAFPEVKEMYLKVCITGIQRLRFKCLFLKCLV